MKIMQIITSSQLGGAQAVLIQLIELALKEKHTIILVSHSTGPLWRSLPESPYLKKYKLPCLVRAIDPLKDLLTIFHFWRIALKERPDIIHLHSAKAGFLGRLAFLFKRRRVLYTQHGFDSILKAHPKMLYLEKLAASWCYAQVAVSHYDKRLLESVKIHGGIYGIYVIHNGCPSLVLPEGKLPYQSLFEELKSQGKKIILSISRFDTTQDSQGCYHQPQQKNFPLTLKVAQCLGEDYQIIWIGNTGAPPKTLPNNLTLLGSLPCAKAYLLWADLFLLLSHYEGLPISIIESLSLGVPVLASQVGGVEELIIPQKTGLLDQSNKAHLISEKIKQAFACPQELKLIGTRAREEWEKNFTSWKMYQKYQHLWNKMLEN